MRIAGTRSPVLPSAPTGEAMKVHPDIEREILSRPGVLVNGKPVREPLVLTDPAPPLYSDEGAFQAKIVALAEKCGWLVYHTYDSRRSKEGFPDLVLTRRGEIIFAEVKTTKGKVSDFQKQWIEALGLHVPCCVHCKIAVYVWRPSMWEDIVAVLR